MSGVASPVPVWGGCIMDRRTPLSASVDPPHYQCNTGGPRSRTRTEPVFKTLLGDPRRRGWWPAVEDIALQFPSGESPRQRAYAMLEMLGYADPEEARRALDLPPETLACRTIQPLAPERLMPVQELESREQLRLFLILGSCGPSVYDPERPVIWTNRALTRPVSLFKVGDFYAD